MILMIVCCPECRKELGWKYGEMPNKSYSLTTTTHKKPCDKCYHYDESKEELHFCSLKCLKKYVVNLKEEK